MSLSIFPPKKIKYYIGVKIVGNLLFFKGNFYFLFPRFYERHKIEPRNNIALVIWSIRLNNKREGPWKKILYVLMQFLNEFF